MQLLFQAIIIKFNVTSDSIEKIACTVNLFLDEHVMKSQSFLIIYLIGFFSSCSNIKNSDYILFVIDENSIVQYFIEEF